MDIDLYLDSNDPNKMVEVYNPTKNPYTTKVLSVEYTVPPFGKVSLKKSHANILSKRLSWSIVQDNKIITSGDRKKLLDTIRLYED